MENTTLIQCKHLTPDFENEVYAGNALELNFNAGTLVTMLGSNHSEKSTWLRTIAGLSIPASGRVIIEGKNIDDMDKYAWTQYRKKYAYIHSDTEILSAANAVQNVILPAKYHNISDIVTIKNKALKLLDEIEVDCDYNVLPAYLRREQRLKIAIARALILEPVALILDNPFSSFDKITRTKFQQFLISRVKNHNTLIIIKTHETEFALENSDQILFATNNKIHTFADRIDFEASNEPDIQHYLENA